MHSMNFTEEDWRRVLRDAAAWWAGELDRPLVYLALTDPVPLPRRYGYFTNYPRDMDADRIVDLWEPWLAATRYCGDGFPWVWCNFGPGILAGFLGAEVHSVVSPSETVWFGAPAAEPIRRTRIRFDTTSPWWTRMKEITGAFVRRFGRDLVFGHTDIGGNLDVIASMRGTENLLLEMMDEPREVDRLVRETTEAWLRCYDGQAAMLRGGSRAFSTWAPLLSEGTTYMLQSDFSYMISPAQFERFVMPDLAACCGRLDNAFYHLDGKGEIPHLDLLLSLERLRGIQWVPGDGQPTPDRWPELLRRIRGGGKLCQLFVTPEGARRVVSTVGGRGFLLVVQPKAGEIPDGETAKAFLRELEREDASRTRGAG